MHLQSVCLEEGKHALEASQPHARSLRGDLTFWAVKKQWQVSIQVQAVKRESRAIMAIQ